VKSKKLRLTFLVKSKKLRESQENAPTINFLVKSKTKKERTKEIFNQGNEI
jgi:hypothetical protein